MSAIRTLALLALVTIPALLIGWSIDRVVYGDDPIQACADFHDSRAFGWAPAPDEMDEFRRMDAECAGAKH